MLSLKKNILGFTLIELMIVIVILGVLASLITGQFITSLKKGRDAKRKSDLGHIKSALEMFYEDKRRYPDIETFGFGLKFCEDICAIEEKVYMQIVPNDPVANNTYQYQTDENGTFFRLFSCIENELDESNGVSQTGYTGGPANCGSGSCQICRYTIFSPNITPLPTP